MPSSCAAATLIVADFVLRRFDHMRERGLRVRGYHLQERAQEINLNGFHASNRWLSHFLKINRSVSRKMTLVRSKHDRNPLSLAETANLTAEF